MLLFILTYLGIEKSHSDSLQLLKRQGTALIESLILSADNAIKANSFFDLLIQEKFTDMVAFLESRPDLEFETGELADFANAYGVEAILIFDDSASLVSYGARGVMINIYDIQNAVVPEVRNLFQKKSSFSNMLTSLGDLPGEVAMYYLEKTADSRYIVVIVSDALFYSESKKSIGIGYLVRNIAQEVAIEYILFQAYEGIVFSSRKIGPIPKIENDLFLSRALEADTVLSRKHLFNDREVLELIKLFSSLEYGDGLFRLGLSLDKYNEIVAGFDRQMILLSVVIFAVIVLATLYLIGKQKRFYLDQSIKQIQTLSEKVFDSINAGLVAIGRDGIVEKVNREFLANHHVSEEHLIGTNWSSLSYSDIVPFNEFLAGNQNHAEYNTTRKSEGTERFYLVNIARLTDPGDNLTGAVAIIYDYTHVKELESAARRKERLSELGDLAAGVAHEIRNPLNSISIAAQRLISEFEPMENREEFVSFAGQIKSEAGRLNDIVTRFLSLARGKGEATGIINLSRTTEETIRMLELELESRSISINQDITPDISLAISEDRFKQMVINLVRNSIEACREKGGKIAVSLEKEKQDIRFTVADTGPGIPPDLNEKIFNPYFSTKEKGTGLGLSIVHQIVEEFDGRIELQTPESGGIEFNVYFPVK
jgi:PAS domain S-box-containing protein